MLDPQELWALVILYFLVGAGLQAFLILQFAAAADAADFGHWKTGKRVEALLFGIMIFLNKAALALGAALIGVILTATGFVPGQVQSDGAILGIRATTYLIPAISLVIGAFFVFRFPISAEFHKQIRSDIRDGTKSAQK